MNIQIENLTKSFYKTPILKNFSLKIDSGESVGIFGPNGSGKTSLLKMICGIMSIDSGKIKIDDLIIHPEKTESRKDVYYLGHSVGLYPSLTGEENIDFLSKLYGIIKGDIDNVLTKVGLKNDGGKLVKFYSQGMLQRLKLAVVITLTPRVLLLDEPKTGLDENGISLFDELFTDWKNKNKTMFIVSHDREWLRLHTDRIIELK
tara:strand:+ start:4033 stop:4644 length:612 start_codon:yes stop_codon:yes gene_type:complete